MARLQNVQSAAPDLIASATLKAQTYGQTTSLAALLFPHFFEHSLGYAFTSALAGSLYLLPGRKG